MHQMQLVRVSNKIAPAVLAFVLKRWASGRREFFCDELYREIRQQHPDCAPDSPARVLRSLRQAQAFDYVIVNRAQSLYRIVSVRQLECVA